jgi:hypothetical protein
MANRSFATQVLHWTRRRGECAGPRPAAIVRIGLALHCGADPWSAADALVGLPHGTHNILARAREAGQGALLPC